ncbi:hypothetical protein [Micromonospora chersina]|uniref:hypothetical protein n=1 Tax=Micromonospora chersina TaxID=47854 RepID=UPI00371FD8CA
MLPPSMAPSTRPGGTPVGAAVAALDAFVFVTAETALLRAARERGLPAHPGEPMSAHQIDAYLDFFGL